MNVVCLGSWRALCKGLQSVPSSQSHLISWTAAIGDISRPIRQPVRSFFTPKQIHPGATKCLVARLAHLSLSNERSDNACLSTQAGARNAAASPSRVRSLIKSEAFSKDDIASIFGKKVRHDEGNRLLHLVQEQRLSGTIDQETFASPEHKQKALSWLRKTYPVDEEQAIIDRLEREEKTALQSVKHPTESVYGDPVIDQIKRRNLARQAQKDAEKAKAEAKAHLDLPVSSTKAMAKREERRSINRAWLQKYEKKAEEAGLESVPQMTFIQRVGPVTVAAYAVIFSCIMFAMTYKPPSRAARLFPNISMAAATIGGLIGINCTVWLAWKWAPLWRFMHRGFILTPAYPYARSIVGNLFSHQAASHLAANMAVLWFVGTKLHEDIGRGPFLALYVGCGVAASHVLVIYTVIRKNWALASLGCSGAISALLATWLWINREKGVRLWPLPPAATESIQPLFVLISLVALDLVRLRRRSLLAKLIPGDTARIDHISHLAGYGFGLMAAQFLKLEPRIRQQKKNSQHIYDANPHEE
ncbi:MAG: hypothetical protein Q9205_001354 [Flavoplaca limonia]